MHFAKNHNLRCDIIMKTNGVVDIGGIDSMYTRHCLGGSAECYKEELHLLIERSDRAEPRTSRTKT